MKKYVSYLIVLIGLASPVQAADLPYPDVIGYEQELKPTIGGEIYVALRGSLSYLDDTNFNIAGPTNIDNQYETGLTFGVAVGHSVTGLFENVALRGEIEAGYLFHDIDSHVVGGAPFPGSQSFGETSAVYGLINAYVDYTYGNFMPFVGVGIGAASVDLDGHGVDAAGVVMADYDLSFAYQLSAGLAYKISDHITVEGGYRYFSAPNVKLQSVDQTESETGLHAHNLQMGLRVGF
jgi:opacity protein-like surface antigen